MKIPKTASLDAIPAMTQMKQATRVETELDIEKTVKGDCTKESNRTKNYSISANHTINRTIDATERD